MNSSNRFDLNYKLLAQKFIPQSNGIIDCHTHIVGAKAAEIYARAAYDYGVSLTYSMTGLPAVAAVKDVLGDRIKFIAFPDWSAPDPEYSFGEGYTETIEKFYELGSRIVKFWSAPRGVDIGTRVGRPDLLKIDAPHRIASMKRAYELGMIFMVHVGDPDTWFQTRYTDANRYGTKRDQYIGFERVLDMFDRPWIGAHMGGWPESLEFLHSMLERHPNLYLDTSATKWMVRELSKFSRSEIVSFFSHWRGRIFFGSDIVTNDAHLVSEPTGNEMADKAGSPEQAYDLYASRYWALRTLFETDYQGESPISDPDLAMVNPEQFDKHAAPRLRGMSMGADMLNDIYNEAFTTLITKWRL
jgi:hypothetical protein